MRCRHHRIADFSPLFVHLGDNDTMWDVLGYIHSGKWIPAVKQRQVKCIVSRSNIIPSHFKFCLPGHSTFTSSATHDDATCYCASRMVCCECGLRDACEGHPQRTQVDNKGCDEPSHLEPKRDAHGFELPYLQLRGEGWSV